MIVRSAFMKHSWTQLKPVLALQDFKPAGTDAEERTVAALAALRATHPEGYHGISGMWSGCLLQRGFLFQRRSDQATFVSLDFRYYAALGWRVESVEPEGSSKKFWVMPKFRDDGLEAAAANLQFLCNTKLSASEGASNDDMEEYLGIPCELRSLTHDWSSNLSCLHVCSLHL